MSAKKKDFTGSLADQFLTPTEVIQEQQESTVHDVETLREPKEIGSTQGKKGQKLKRMTMAFGDENYKFARQYALDHETTVTALVNDLLTALRLGKIEYTK